MWLVAVVLLILKLTVLPAMSWWIVAAPLLLVAAIYVVGLLVAGVAAIVLFKTLD